MAINWVQGKGAFSTTPVATLSATFSAAVASGDTVCGLVSFGHAASSALTSVTDNKSNTYNLETLTFDSTNDQDVIAFSLSNITNGPTVITANFTNAEGGQSIIIDEFSGCATAASDERDLPAAAGNFQNTPGTGTNAVTSPSRTTVTNGDLLYGATSNNAGDDTTLTAGTGFTLTGTSSGVSGNTAAMLKSEWMVQTTAGAVAATFTNSPSADRVTFLIPIKAGATAAAVTLGRSSNRIHQPGQGPDFGMRSPKAFPPSIANAVYLLSASQGTYTLTGFAVTPQVGMPATQGTYTLTGEAQTLGVGMPAAEGTYSLTGFAATMSVVPNPVGIRPSRIFQPSSLPHLNLRTAKAFPVLSTGPASYTLSATEGTYSLTGFSTILNRGVQVSAAHGTYSLTGEAQSFLRGINISATEGTYALNGQSQTLTVGMPAAEGAYTLTGQSQTMAVGIPVAQGSYTLTGETQSFAVALSTLAQEGVYTLTGRAQVLNYTPAGSGGAVHGNPFLATPGPMTSIQ
jgi:hypothetical protein